MIKNNSEQKQDIRDLSYQELAQYFEGVGEKSFRADQVYVCVKTAPRAVKRGRRQGPAITKKDCCGHGTANDNYRPRPS